MLNALYLSFRIGHGDHLGLRGGGQRGEASAGAAGERNGPGGLEGAGLEEGELGSLQNPFKILYILEIS